MEGMARVLVAERNTGLRSLFVTAMRRAGHQVESAADGDEALLHLGAAPFDCILVGAPLMLRFGEPRTLLEYLEHTAAEVASRVVVLTTRSFDHDLLLRAIRLRVCALVHEPFDIQELIRTAEDCSRNARPAQRLVGFPARAIQALERKIGRVEW